MIIHHKTMVYLIQGDDNTFFCHQQFLLFYIFQLYLKFQKFVKIYFQSVLKINILIVISVNCFIKHTNHNILHL